MIYHPNADPETLAKNINVGIDRMAGEIAILKGIIAVREKINDEALARAETLALQLLQANSRAEIAEKKRRELQEAVESHLNKAWGYEATFSPLRAALAKSKEK